ncbi:predicted protein [Pyrenophora tritici-repentis Pt-1C-BFP]|uniref:Uncharacterized protein n=1 Tax=Pyrenophora tritici-repentis (strain Pt-1C-BFP) TaxID=426418 RepID=B2W5V4_PYRTR|nr:uncharacterized protein PTRG_06112 [Pyrenophora tritici-repentis Pt-1C-BFP]EDU49032.1 predicted protein [Pyrenophora tritici-repentis Pt-1C-BFP]
MRHAALRRPSVEDWYQVPLKQQPQRQRAVTGPSVRMPVEIVKPPRAALPRRAMAME